MKAMQLVSPRTFKMVQVPVPHLHADNKEQLLVRTCWVSLCGSDIAFFAGNKRHVSYPLSPGAPIHECIGQVVESTSNQYKPGEYVITIPDGNQALAEYVVAQVDKSVKLPPESVHGGTSCLIQPLSTVMNAIDRLGTIEGKSFTIVGLGSNGLLFCWLLKKRGVSRIVGIDPNSHRCQIAEKLGADNTYPMRSIEVVQNARQNPDEWELSDYCIEVVGHQMETINDCFELIRMRGTVVAFGVPDHNVYAIEYEKLFRKNAILMATVTPNWQEYMGKAMDLFEKHRQELEPLTTHKFPIREAEKAFGLYERHEDGIIKAVLDTTDW